MPLASEYSEQLKSPIADLKNIGERGGGSITAALFLQEFVSKSTAWAHLDIAGPSYNAGGPDGHLTNGGTGFAVATLVDLARGLA